MSKVRENLVEEYYVGGMTLMGIANKLGVSLRTAHYYKQKLGLPTNHYRGEQSKNYKHLQPKLQPKKESKK